MILLQILDEGSLTDSQGRKVDFKVVLSIQCLYCSLSTSHHLEHNHLFDEQSRYVPAGYHVLLTH